MTSTKSKEIADEYISSLSDLTINSKPLINMLTMLAEDNVEHAPAIVQAVENHLQKVRSEIKLPVLYLIDSIVKNVNGAYLSLFTQNIVNTFCCVFDKVDENTRSSMWKLRQTWNEVFPAKKLYSLDVRVQSIDPAWPITTPPPQISSGSIHVNPRFLVSTPTTPTPPIGQSPSVSLTSNDSTSMSEAVMREQLLKKKRELLELQKRKLDLELLQAETSLEQQRRQLDKQVAGASSVVVPTAHVIPTTDVSQPKPVAPVVPSQATKLVAKQFPAAAASLLKNVGSANGPRIAPASSIAVASARPVSRDPRLKPLPSVGDQGSGSITDPRLRPISSSDVHQKVQQPVASAAAAGGGGDGRGGEGAGGGAATAAAAAALALASATTTSISTVLSDQLKQQLITKQAVTSAMSKPLSNNAGSDFASTFLNASNNDNPISAHENANNNNNNNNNNKTLSGITNKEGVTHRASQKKEPRTSSNNNANNNSSKSIQSQSQTAGLSTLAGSAGGSSTSLTSMNSSTLMSGLRGSGSVIGDSKSRETTKSSRGSGGTSSSSIDKSSTSSKSSHRKLGNKTRSKQPQASPSKISKIDRESSPTTSTGSSPVRSKSRENENSNSIEPNNAASSITNRTSPLVSSSSSTSSSSSFQSSSKSRSKKISLKSRKRSPSPPYRIPRRHNDSNKSSSSSNNTSAVGLTEEEQSGSLIVSPPHPPSTFKDIRANTRLRNYVRRNKDEDNNDDNHDDEVLPDSGNNPLRSVSPQAKKDNSLIDSTSKDEDLRSSVNLPNLSVTTGAIPEKIEDLDLRILPPVSSKRHSSEHAEPVVTKKSKAEKFDALFGNEDVDLRTLTHPKAGRPPTPPPPVISGEDGKDSWAKLKTPSKGDREKQAGSGGGGGNNEDKRDRDRNKDRLGRPRLYNKLPDDPKERRRTLSSEEPEVRPNRRGSRGGCDNDKMERNSDRNIEIIMKQAAEQLKQGCISSSDYNTLIQEVLHMSEDQKLRAAQRKEKETVIWEPGINLEMNRIGGERPGSAFSPSMDGGDLPRSKDHGHPRNRNGPRWQQQNHQPWQQPPAPWAHPPGPSFPPVPPPQGHFNTDFRPVGPWQNPRAFGPIRPDYVPYHRGFNANMPPNPRMGMMPGMGVPNGPILNIMQNGPLGPMGISTPPPSLQLPSINGPSPIIINSVPLQSGQITNMIGNSNLPPITPVGAVTAVTGANATAVVRTLISDSSTIPNCDLEDSQDSSNLRQNSSELPLPDPKQLEAIANDRMKSIEIDGEPREIRYYGQTGIVFMKVDDPREIGFQDGTRRVLIDDKETILCAFNEPYKEFIYEGQVHRIRLGGPSRELYIDDRWYECYFGGLPIKVDLGNKKVSVKLEGPPPQVKIGSVKRRELVVGKVHLILDARELVPVFVDSKPQIFEIDGKPQILEFIDCLERVLLNGRPFKVVFGGLPTSIIVRGKKHFFRFTVLPPGIRPGYVKILGMRGEPPKEYSQEMIQESPASTTIPSIQSAEHDSASQDSSELITPGINSELQVNALPSTLAAPVASPTSTVPYKAEITEATTTPAPPVLTLPLNMNELFQRLVETGIVPNITGQKKPDEEEKKEPVILPVSFDKPETLKVKQPAIASALYSGIQCSSCGARFAPELATRYSHHLDWHFRQNRRERDSARKAHSRPWYYDVSDWIQFEEIEDLEDRAQSWFETEKQTAETEGTATEDSPQETTQPSVPTGSDEDSRCQVCHDVFEQFYNEEKEEWHLRPTVTYEGKNYHPMCLEDHKRSLEKSALALLEEEKKEAADESTTMPEELKALESETTKENTDAEMIEEKILEDKNIADESVENNANNENSIAKSDDEMEKVKISEESSNEEAQKIEGTDKDIEEDKLEGGDDAVLNNLENIKIKEEPIDPIESEELQEGENGFQFGNVEIKQEPTDPEPDHEESMLAESAVVDTTHTAVKSSIDGNVELDSATTTIPPAPSRIKINITKPLATKEPDDSKEKPKDKSTGESLPEETTTPLVAASLKPALQGRKLSNLPPIEKGHELSGLCSIM
ncbi:uncharacterized protein [Venturia canescens]|uniref:uncharacterized protein isoform X3 n=1 Tax=Venturia canescens TaxID=32260 RepID=UPI001C9CDF13|nr:uncharacterized protein LOC122419153 isoform X3 [Venturia canescens]